MQSPSFISILRALSLIGAFATASSCHAAIPEKPPPQVTTPREPADRPHPIPTATATATLTPVAPTPTASPKVTPGPLAVSPIEVRFQPIEVQRISEDVHLTASGIPEKIMLDWQVRPLSLELRWPKESLNISVDLKNVSTAAPGNGFEKAIDAFSQLNRECRERLGELNKKLADEAQKAEQLRKAVSSSGEQKDKSDEQLRTLQNNLINTRAQLVQQNKIYTEELDRLRRAGKITPEELGEIKRKIESHGQKSPTEMFWCMVVSGLLGGLSIGIINALESKPINSGRITDENGGTAKATSSSDPFSVLSRVARRLWPGVVRVLPDVLRGVVAALIVPAVLYFKPGKLEIAADNHYALISLYSLCFVAAMLGKKFIDAVLSTGHRWLERAELQEPGEARDNASVQRHPVAAGLTALAKGSSLVTGWALGMLGATVVGIVYGKYLHPSGPFRYIYLLFPPGWILLAASILYGEKVTRRLAASAFTTDNQRLGEIGRQMNTEYAKQRLYFQLALLAFAIWLLALLLWWIFTGDIPGGE